MSKFKIEQATEIMLTVAYPTLIELMKHVGLQRTQFDIQGYYPVYIDVDQNYYWDTGNGIQSGLVTNILERKFDPELVDINDSDNPNFPFKPDAYYLWCEMVMDKIDELKAELPKVYRLIDRLNKIQVTYNREVLIEKN